MQQRTLETIERRLENQLETLSESMRKEWAIHPCTQALMTTLYLLHEQAKASWANGGFTGESKDATIQLNSEAIGKCDAYVEVYETATSIGATSD